MNQRKLSQCFDRYGKFKSRKYRLPRKLKKAIKKLDAELDAKFTSKYFKRIPTYEIMINTAPNTRKYRF